MEKNVCKIIVVKPVYNELKHLKIKIKVYNKKFNTNFCGIKIPRNNSQSFCLSVISLDQIFAIGENYYLQVFREKCVNNQVFIEICQ